VLEMSCLLMTLIGHGHGKEDGIGDEIGVEYQSFEYQGRY